MKYIDDPDFDPQEIIDRIQALTPRYAGSRTLSGKMLFQPRRPPPSRVYKYTSSTNAQIILKNMSLRYTQCEVLDDIFEEAPHRDEIRRIMPDFEDGPTLVIDVFDNEDRLNMFDRVKNARANMRNNNVVLSDDVAIFTAEGIDRDWNYELGNRNLKYAFEISHKPLALSLTELNNSLVMWSNYGDSHKGVQLGFNTRSKYFRSNRDLIDRSGYFAPIDYRPINIDDYAYRFPYERFFIKTLEWIHQREWRRIEFTEHNLGINWMEEVCTFPFPADALDSVTFGARCPADLAHFLADYVQSQPKLAHVRICQARNSIGQLIIEDM